MYDFGATISECAARTRLALAFRVWRLAPAFARGYGATSFRFWRPLPLVLYLSPSHLPSPSRPPPHRRLIVSTFPLDPARSRSFPLDPARSRSIPLDPGDPGVSHLALRHNRGNLRVHSALALSFPAFPAMTAFPAFLQRTLSSTG